MIEVGPNLFHATGTPPQNIRATTVAISVVRDEMWRLPFFLAYHRWLGVEHFIVIDNRSQDGTPDLLQRERDVTCISAPGDFGTSQGQWSWIDWALRLAPPERWNLALDADELFVGSTLKADGLLTLTHELNREGAAIAAASMVDCYPEKFPFPARSFEPVPWNRAPYFDVGPYFKRSASNEISRRYNGVRERLFWPNWRWRQRIKKFVPRSLRPRLLRDPPPNIIKMPLLRNVPGLIFDTAHSSSGGPRSRNVYAILHYKFDVDLASKVDLALRERQHWQGSHDYEAYARIFSKPDFDLRFKGTRRFEGMRSLVDAELVCFVEANQHSAGLYEPPLGDVEKEVWGFGDYALQKQVWEQAWGPTPERNTGSKSPDKWLSTV